MGAAQSFPLHPPEVTPEWLTDALRQDGCIREARVVSLTYDVIGAGVGFLGQIARITPAYDVTEEGAPRTVIGKFPGANEDARQMAAMYGFYACEVNAYRHLTPHVAIRTPRCYYSAISDDATTFFLLLEDLGADGRMGDQVAGCSADDARLAVRELAKLHASWWDDPRLAEMDWLPLGTTLGRMSMSQAYPVSWQICLDQFGHLLTQAQRDALPTLNERLLLMMDDFDTTPLTIMHADYRLDNMFFGHPGGPYEFAVIDWQITNKGWALYDVAYFLGTNLDPALRRAEEMGLLREYHAVLTRERTRGDDYDWETCRRDYVRSILMYFANFIGNAASLDPANPRGLELFGLMISRISAAVDDLDALSSIP